MASSACSPALTATNSPHQINPECATAIGRHLRIAELTVGLKTSPPKEQSVVGRAFAKDFAACWRRGGKHRPLPKRPLRWGLANRVGFNDGGGGGQVWAL